MSDTSGNRPFGYEGARRKAERVADDDARTEQVLDRAAVKAERLRNRRRVRTFWHDLTALFRLLRAWRRRTYREVPTKSIVASLAAVMYFLSPIDLLPDFIPFLGFLDDAAVIAWVVRSIAADLARFREWEADDGPVVDIQAESVVTTEDEAR